MKRYIVVYNPYDGSEFDEEFYTNAKDEKDAMKLAKVYAQENGHDFMPIYVYELKRVWSHFDRK